MNYETVRHFILALLCGPSVTVKVVLSADGCIVSERVNVNKSMSVEVAGKSKQSFVEVYYIFGDRLYIVLRLASCVLSICVYVYEG